MSRQPPTFQRSVEYIGDDNQPQRVIVTPLFRGGRNASDQSIRTALLQALFQAINHYVLQYK